MAIPGISAIGPYTSVNWLKFIGLPGYKRIYTGFVAHDVTPNMSHVYVALKCINKNKSPERHEFIFMCATGNQVFLVERLVKGLDFDSNVGGIDIKICDNFRLYVTAMIDNDKPDAGAMFPVSSFTIDGNMRKDHMTYKV